MVFYFRDKYSKPPSDVKKRLRVSAFEPTLVSHAFTKHGAKGLGGGLTSRIDVCRQPLGASNKAVSRKSGSAQTPTSRLHYLFFSGFSNVYKITKT
ncbi:hypothetical protein NPIL_477311 [Nephila pilipes]|uniref:Uncharacterized protein n=1 Tax=Nephila pilipes TaxID=299642 RepID=A0A8X6U8H6_NEPPI|nr:hypothetical protein NPIL_477311 [Nephila pilipes]